MRRRHLSLLLALAMPFAPSAHAAEQARAVAPFTTVSNSGPISISIDVGKAQSVMASGTETFLSELTTEVVDGELRIRLKDKSAASTLGDPKVTITMPQLTRFTMSGAGATTISHMTGDHLDVHYSGAGSLKADGTVKSLKLSVSGVGDIDTQALHADNVAAQVSGVGSVKVWAAQQLDASVSGVGSLVYYGNPKTVNTSGGGIGSISRGK